MPTASWPNFRASEIFRYRPTAKICEDAKLDCAVTNLLHQIREDSELPAYDTVRGLFWEGAPIYEGAAVPMNSDHIQICVRDASCILGYFRPIELSG